MQGGSRHGRPRVTGMLRSARRCANTASSRSPAARHTGGHPGDEEVPRPAPRIPAAAYLPAPPAGPRSGTAAARSLPSRRGPAHRRRPWRSAPVRAGRRVTCRGGGGPLRARGEDGGATRVAGGRAVQRAGGHRHRRRHRHRQGHRRRLAGVRWAGVKRRRGDAGVGALRAVGVSG